MVVKSEGVERKITRMKLQNVSGVGIRRKKAGGRKRSGTGIRVFMGGNEIVYCTDRRKSDTKPRS